MSTEPTTDPPRARSAFYLIGSAGAILLLSGEVLPAVELFWGYNKAYIGYFLPEGILLLLLVAASIILMKRRELRLLLIVGALSLYTVFFSYARNEHGKSVRISKAYEQAYATDAAAHRGWHLWEEPDAESYRLRKEIIEGDVNLVRMSLEGERYKEAWDVLIAGGVLLMTAGLLTYRSVEQWVCQTFAVFERSEKRCPSCAGLNAAEAVKCKHCGEAIG